MGPEMQILLPIKVGKKIVLVYFRHEPGSPWTGLFTAPSLHLPGHIYS